MRASGAIGPATPPPTATSATTWSRRLRCCADIPALQHCKISPRRLTWHGHRSLFREGLVLGYPPRMLHMLIQMYRQPRRLKGYGTFWFAAGGPGYSGRLHSCGLYVGGADIASPASGS
eukprot:6587273-Pyramimonas_sp.AAC.1